MAAKEIIHRAEKQLLQDRSKCINGILCNTGVKVGKCRSRLLSIVTTTTIDRCIEFINKVRECRFIKVRDWQVYKFNILSSKSNRGTSAQSLGNTTQSQAISNKNKWVINLSKTPQPKPKNPYYLRVLILP